MRRLTFFKVLLPTTLVVFVVLLALAYRQPPPVHGLVPGETNNVRSAENVEYFDYNGAERGLEFLAEMVAESAEGDFHLETVKRLVLPRGDRGPLIVSAGRGDIVGDEGMRMMRFESGVVIRDPDDGLSLSIPVLEVDEQAGQASQLVIFDDVSCMLGTPAHIHPRPDRHISGHGAV